jgi:CHAT domain-containing protein/Tfp pilus assembly protein PilF
MANPDPRRVLLAALGILSWGIALGFDVGIVRAGDSREVPKVQVRDNRQAEADRLFDEALELYRQGTEASYRAAIAQWEQALAIYRELGSDSADNTAKTLIWIGSAYEALGQPQQALEHYQQALRVRREIGDRPGVALALNNVGSAYYTLGQFQQALDHFEQALSAYRELGDRASMAPTLNNIGNIYSILGQPQRALDYFEQTLAIVRESENRPGEAITLVSLGVAHLKLEQFQQALKYYEQALPIFRDIGHFAGVATALHNIGGIYDKLGQPQRVLESYEQALPIFRKIGDRVGIATTLTGLGRAYDRLGQSQQAIDYHQQALSIHRQVGDRSTEAVTLYNLAVAHRNLGNFDEAIESIEATLDIVETLRSDIASPELRTSYFATLQNYYSFYIDLLMELHRQQPDAGYDALAFHASERTRARSLIELLAEANVNIRRGIPPELTERENTLRQQLNAAALQRQALWRGGEPDRSAIAAIDRQIQQLETELQQVEADIRQTSPEAAALKYPEPLTLEEVQRQVVDEETVLLQYFLGKDRSFVWVVTSDDLTSVELPGREQITRLTTKVRRTITDRIARRRQLTIAASALADAILAPVADRLAGKRLLVVADGILQTIPFSVLATPGQSKYTPLLVNYEIVHSPSSSLIGTVRQFHPNRPQPANTLAVVADPVFGGEDDDRANVRGEANLQSSACYAKIPTPLPGTATEAEAVTNLVSPSEMLVAMEFDAQRQLILSDTLSQYRIVHLATHGCFDETNPSLSALALSLVDEAGNAIDGYLRLHDIYNLNLPADLVVLSACQTAMGENVRGEGTIGLTRGFFQAGTSRLVASLWKVSDASTAQLMEQFYRNYLDAGMTPAQALRSAQLQMWEDQTNPAWQNPYYWAAFVFQGEWR